MQTPTDISLLQRWREQRDAGAFRTLTQRYGGMVYGICNRVLRNPADAEEVTQDCFLKLAQHPATAERAVGPWLHSVAVRGSLDRVRSERRRRDRELAYENDGGQSDHGPAQDLLAQIDEAISLLPPELRECVVTHFLEGRSQAEAGAHLGISERTVRRRSGEAIERVRDFLNVRGIATNAAILAASLASLNAQALPPVLGLSLGKLAIGGKAHAAATTTLSLNTYETLGGLLAMKKAMGIGAGLVFITLAAWWQLGGTAPGSTGNSEGPTVASENGSQSNAAVATREIDAAPEARTMPTIADEPTPEIIEASATATTSAKAARPALAPEPIADPTKYGALAGIVLDERGRTVPDARIDVLVFGEVGERETMGAAAFSAQRAALSKLWDHDEYRFSATTNNAGEFAIDGIPFAGGASIVATADGFERKQTGGSIAPETTTEVTITLQSARPIHGEVVTPGGLAVADAAVNASSLFSGNGVQGKMGPPESLWTRTDEKGYFTLWLGNADVHDEAFTSIHVKSAEHGEAQFFPVAVGEEERIKLTLESQWASLSGQILTDDREAAANHAIVLEGSVALSMNGLGTSDSSGYRYETTTDPEGRYTFEELAAYADYSVSISNPAGDEAAKVPLPKLEAGESNTWNYTLEATIRVTGEVRGTGNNVAMADVTVDYTSENAGGADRPVAGQAQTDANGAFAFTIVSGSGSYYFTPRYQNGGYVGTGETDFGKSVELNAGDSTFVSLILPAPWSRSFRIVDQFGQPVEGVGAGMQQHREGGTLGTNRPEQTDAEGFVEFSNLDPAMEVMLNFGKDGFINAQTEYATGQPGEALPVEQVLMYRCAGLSTRLLDGEGNPVANTAVQCVAAYGEGRSATVKAATNADGWLVLPSELPGTQVELRFTTESATGEGSLEARIESAELVPNAENDLGDIVMTVDAQAQEPNAAQ